MSTLTDTHGTRARRISLLVARSLRNLAVPIVLSALTCAFYWKLVFGGLILASYDLFTYFYPYKSYTSAAIASDRLPLWNPNIFMGVPFLANIQTAMFYPPNLADLALMPPMAVTVSIVSHVVLAGLFMYVFLKHSVHVSRGAAFLGGLVFMFSGFLGQQAGHINQLNASIWLPLLLATFDWAVRRRSLRRALISATILAFALLAGHSQESFLIGVIFAGYVAFRLFVMPELRDGEKRRGDGRRSSEALCDPSEPQPPFCHSEPPCCHSEPQRRISPFVVARGPVMWLRRSWSVQRGDPSPRLRMTGKRRLRSEQNLGAERPGRLRHVLHDRLFLLATSAIVVSVGIGLAAVQLIPTYELSKESIRSGGLPYAEAISFSLSPLLLARSLLPGYFSNPFSEYIGYIGVAPLLLAILALIRRPRNRFVWFALVVAIGAVILATGGYDPLYPKLYRHVPGLNLFRVPARWLYAYTFAASMLVGIGADALVRTRCQERSALQSRIRTLLLFVGVLCVIGLALWTFRSSILPPTPETPVLWLLFGGLGTLLIAAGLWRLRGVWLTVPLGCLYFGELLLAAQGLELNQPLPLETYINTPVAATQLLTQTGSARILSISPGEFVPGDEPEVERMLARDLPLHEITAFLITLKYSQTLTPNIPMRFGLASMDGYDGGVLPLRRYAQLKQMIAQQFGGGGTSAEQADATLRLQLSSLPDSRLLGRMGVKYVLADKTKDLWQDGVYYDLSLPITATFGSPVVLDAVPDFRSTSLRLLSHLNGGQTFSRGEEIARLVVQAVDGSTQVLPIRAGVESGWLSSNSSATLFALPSAQAVELPGGATYLATLNLYAPTSVRQVRVEFTSTSGALRIDGLTFVDDRLGLSEPSTSNGKFRRIYSGDVKIYENLDAKTQMYLVPRALVTSTDVETLDHLARHPADDVVLLSAMPGDEGRALVHTDAGNPRESGSVTRQARIDEATASPATSPGSADLLIDQPELRRVAVTIDQPAFLMFAESAFPGWQARVDGQPAELLRADHLFQTVYVPAGSHEVEFVYTPLSVRLGWAISGAALALVIGAFCLATLGRLARRLFGDATRTGLSSTSHRP